MNEYLSIAPRGERARIARAVGVAAVLVTQWISTRGFPAERVLAVAEATGWLVTPHDLRPDIYPHPDDGLPPERRGGGAGEEAA